MRPRSSGSSPLARGLRHGHGRHRRRRRIIPARAGFTDDVGVVGGCEEGSSPLARGLLIAVMAPIVLLGIIPARAGFTQRSHAQVHRLGDHPRSRGVYISSHRRRSGRHGSSPLARGLRERPRQRLTQRRIIPARAGFTECASAASRAARGSSPLARGLLAARGAPRPGPGIIPARAGFTHRRGPGGESRRDHPRSRGVYPAQIAAALASPGSSPLARGLLKVLVHRAPTGRIIPARAGFTRRHPQAGRRHQDHPRSRGVYHILGLSDNVSYGSSPLARGLPGGRVIGGAEQRIIPARAGFTTCARPLTT